MTGGPGLLFWAAALVCVVGPLTSEIGTDIRFESRSLFEYLSTAFAIVSGFLALSTSRPRSNGITLWAASGCWLLSMVWLFVPFRGWLFEHHPQLSYQLADVQALSLVLAAAAFVAVAARAIVHRDGWDVHTGIRVVHGISLLLLAGYLVREALVAYASTRVSESVGLSGLIWELKLGRYVALVAGTLLAFSVGARHVLRGVAPRRPTSGCS